MELLDYKKSLIFLGDSKASKAREHARESPPARICDAQKETD